MVPRPDAGPGTWQTLRCVERRTRLQKVRSCPLPDSPPLPSRQLHAPAHTGWAAPGAPWSFVLLDLCTCSCLTCSPRPLPIPHNPGTSSPPPPMGPEPLTWAGLWGAAHLQGLQYTIPGSVPASPPGPCTSQRQDACCSTRRAWCAEAAVS